MQDRDSVNMTCHFNADAKEQRQQNGPAIRVFSSMLVSIRATVTFSSELMKGED
jgi:hypothetical protein